MTDTDITNARRAALPPMVIDAGTHLQALEDTVLTAAALLGADSALQGGDPAGLDDLEHVLAMGREIAAIRAGELNRPVTLEGPIGDPDPNTSLLGSALSAMADLLAHLAGRAPSCPSPRHDDDRCPALEEARYVLDHCRSNQIVPARHLPGGR